MLTIERSQTPDGAVAQQPAATKPRERDVETIKSLVRAARPAGPDSADAVTHGVDLRAIPLVVTGLAVVMCASILLVWAMVL